MCNCSKNSGKQCKQCIPTCIKFPPTPLYNPCGCNCNPCYPDRSCCKPKCNPCENPCKRRRQRRHKSKHLLQDLDYNLFKQKNTNDLVMDDIFNSCH